MLAVLHIRKLQVEVEEAACYHLLTSVSGPSVANVPNFLFQAEMLHDPEFAKKVRGLERMLRVRTRTGDSDSVSLGTGASGNGLRSSVVPGRRLAGEFRVEDSCRVALDDSGQALPVEFMVHPLRGVMMTVVLRFRILFVCAETVLPGVRGGLEEAPPAGCPSASVPLKMV